MSCSITFLNMTKTTYEYAVAQDASDGGLLTKDVFDLILFSCPSPFSFPHIPIPLSVQQ